MTLVAPNTIHHRILKGVFPIGQQNPSVRDALALLCATHRRNDRVENMELKGRALASFHKDVLQMGDSARLAMMFVLLFSDVVDNGKSAWRIHLAGVRTILRSRLSRGLPIAEDDFQRMLVLQFYWWDTIGSLLSMQDPVLPQLWFDQILVYGASDAQRHQFKKMNPRVHQSPFSLALLPEEVEVVSLDDSDRSAYISQSPEAIRQRELTDKIWKHALAGYSVVSCSPFLGAPYIYHSHAYSIFESTNLLSPEKTGEKSQIMFPLFVASTYVEGSARDHIREYCTDRFLETQSGSYRPGFSVMEQSFALRKIEATRRKQLDAAAYFSWRNLMATDDSNFAVYG